MIGGADLERGAVAAGGRGYYLMGPAVCLQVCIVKKSDGACYKLFYVHL